MSACEPTVHIDVKYGDKTIPSPKSCKSYKINHYVQLPSRTSASPYLNWLIGWFLLPNSLKNNLTSSLTGELSLVNHLINTIHNTRNETYYQMDRSRERTILYGSKALNLDAIIEL